MSALGKVPGFEPDEEAMAMISSMFEQKQEVKKQEQEAEEVEAPKSNITPGKRHRVRIPDAPALTEEEQKIATNLVKEELDLIHDAFLDFSELTSDTVIYGYLYNEILKLTEAFQDMEYMMTETVDETKVTEHGLEDYDKMLKIRARILNDVYNKY